MNMYPDVYFALLCLALPSPCLPAGPALPHPAMAYCIYLPRSPLPACLPACLPAYMPLPAAPLSASPCCPSAKKKKCLSGQECYSKPSDIYTPTSVGYICMYVCMYVCVYPTLVDIHYSTLDLHLPRSHSSRVQLVDYIPYLSPNLPSFVYVVCVYICIYLYIYIYIYICRHSLIM